MDTITISLATLFSLMVFTTLFGTFSGIMFAKYEFSSFTRKFKEDLDKKKAEYEAQIKELQKQDAETVKKLQNTLKATLGSSILAKTPIPSTTEEYN